MAKNQTAKKRKVQVDAIGQAHIHSSFNNIIITLTNNQGQAISQSSAGKMGFRSKKAHDAGLRKVTVYVQGPGNGRESAIRTINNAGIEVMEIIDVTPMPHNGCRPPKRRKP